MIHEEQIGNARRRRRQTGQGLVETALVMLTVTGTIFFVMDVGHYMLIQQFITERARETARNAAVNSWTSDQIKNYLVYNTTTAPNGGGPGYLGLSTSEVTSSFLGTSGSPDYRLQVKVSGVPVFPIPLFGEWGTIGTGSFTAAPVTVTEPAQSLGSAN